MWRTSPTLVNQALPSETSTQEEGDTIHFSVKYVENYFPWSIFKFLVASIEILTKPRQEQKDADFSVNYVANLSPMEHIQILINKH